ncbi:hypothetical protein A4X06_0g7412 [Tilletia controversa]|uniref:Uncharacterized protein n=1 Tax=Tilletia controversa TaxID=13291 RepID=A0A8X7MM36_9BASI|nr:hypothetical protein A4X06_0g7412 [Tilletia controversa]
MDQFNDWQHHPAITYDPNGFIANLDPAYISAAEQVPTNTTNPTPNLPTSSQRCLQLLPEDIREAYKIAYEAVKRSIGQHQRPDWDLIWLEAVLSPPELVKDALKAHFDQLFRSPANSTPSTTPSTFNAQGPVPTSASSPTGHSDTHPTSSHTASTQPSTTPLGPSKIANDQPEQTQPSSTVSMSKAALQAISSKGTWKGWHYCGVVRWVQGTCDAEPLSDNEILQHSRKVDKKLRGSRENGTAKGKKERKQTTRAEDYPDIRERWRCATCGIIRHERVATTSNLRKHLRSCGTTTGPK